MDINLAKTIAELVPAIVTAVVFGFPVVMYYIVRQFRFLEKQLEMNRDQKLLNLEHERALLQAQLDHATTELEFLKKLNAPVAAQRVGDPGLRVDSARGEAEEEEAGERSSRKKA